MDSLRRSEIIYRDQLVTRPELRFSFVHDPGRSSQCSLDTRLYSGMENALEANDRAVEERAAVVEAVFGRR